MDGLVEEDITSWSEFEKKAQEFINPELCPSDGGRYVSDYIFRGQSNGDWKLQSTLERYMDRLKLDYDGYGVLGHYDDLLATYPAFETFSNRSFDMPRPDTDRWQEAQDKLPWQLLGYEYMIYLRHLGFPSPLLDWTRSPYVAAYFAFHSANPDQRVAIFCYQSDRGHGKQSSNHRPAINHHGGYAAAHSRHFLQQAEYTTCTLGFKSESKFARYEGCFFGDEQDYLIKYTLPGCERSTVIRLLDAMNINAYSLFANEEGLAEMLAFRELEMRA